VLIKGLIAGALELWKDRGEFRFGSTFAKFGRMNADLGDG
jgi:hypothetical protein